MVAESNRDPLVLLVLTLILLALSWIGFGVANLAARMEAAPPAEARGDERLARALDSLSRSLAVLETQRGSVTAAGGDAGSTVGSARSSAAAAALPVGSAGSRSVLPGSSPSTTSAGMLRAAASHDAKTIASQRHAFHHRLQVAGDVARRAAQRSLLLTTRLELLRRFGRPDQIELNDNGSQEWYFNLDEDGNQIGARLMDGLVVSVW